MLPNITSVGVSPSSLNTGENDIVVNATVTDGTGVTSVSAVLIDSEGWIVTDVTSLTLESGDSLNGTYTGTVVVPPDASDGQYQVAVLASNAETVEEDFGTYGIYVYEEFITLVRGISEPDKPGDTPPDTNEEADKCCCKVSINISSGPVNIYVCGTEPKINSPE
jgi:hypothetical protein